MTSPGQTIAITGGTGGIGLATARRLVDAGASVAVLDLDAEMVAARAVELSAGGGTAVGLAVDTTDETAMNAAVDTVVERFGRLDGMVTAAGIRQTSERALDLDLDVWARIHAVNVTGTFVACRAAARAMIAGGRGGAVVTISSVTSVAARMGQAAYCASKAAVSHLTRTLALEWAEHRIRVNTVCPGPTETPMIRKAVADEGPHVIEDKTKGSLAAFRPGIPLGRLSQPEEQAAAITFLLSPEASYVTGAALSVDGGVSIV